MGSPIKRREFDPMEPESDKESDDIDFTLSSLK